MWPMMVRLELGNADGSYHEQVGWTQEFDDWGHVCKTLQERGVLYGAKGLCVLGAVVSALTLAETNMFRSRK